MNKFEIYTANLPYGSETGTYIIILGNGIVDNVIFFVLLLCLRKMIMIKIVFIFKRIRKREKWVL